MYSQKFRNDIQVLRGYAVMLVVLFHANISIFKAGYLGVDIFFVISGFLITSLIQSGIKNGTFRLVDFYFRRAKRLLPAAYVTFLLTTIGAMLFLTMPELQDYFKQLIGAVTFTANMVLWRQGSYFGGDAEFKPLLHTWSLSIEEQYYLLVPALLLFFSSRRWLVLCVSGILLSLGLCIWFGLSSGTINNPSASFYLFPSRAWELGIGSMGAFIVGYKKVGNYVKQFFFPSILILIFLPIFPFGGMHPGVDSALVCLSTLLFILNENQLIHRNIGSVILSKIGDFSYSLYLVHYPIFAFIATIWMGSQPKYIEFLGVFFSLSLGYILYKFIELPIRRTNINISKTSICLFLSSSFSLIIIGVISPSFMSKSPNYSFIRRGNPGLDQSCAYKTDFYPKDKCKTTKSPHVLVWGDSYAMHIMAGVKEMFGKELGVMQATKYVCGPLLGDAPLGLTLGSTQNKAWADSCRSFNDSVLSYLKSNPQISVVVLSSYVWQFTTPSQYSVIVYDKFGNKKELSGSIKLATEGFESTIFAIRALGRRVVIVAPPPSLEFDAGECVERLKTGKLTFGVNADCKLLKSDVAKRQADVREVLKNLIIRDGVNVIYFDGALDKGNYYQTTLDGKILYIANGHLSYDGSILLAKKIDLGNQILRLAK